MFAPQFHYIFTYFALCLITSSCKLRTVTEQDIPGKYRAGYLRSGEVKENGWEILELLPDGKCLQEIHLDGKTYTASGTWKHNRKTKYIYLWRLRRALLFGDKNNPNVGEPPENEKWAMPISRTIDGKIKIMLTEDINYIKISK